MTLTFLFVYICSSILVAAARDAEPTPFPMSMSITDDILYFGNEKIAWDMDMIMSYGVVGDLVHAVNQWDEVQPSKWGALFNTKASDQEFQRAYNATLSVQLLYSLGRRREIYFGTCNLLNATVCITAGHNVEPINREGLVLGDVVVTPESSGAGAFHLFNVKNIIRSDTGKYYGWITKDDVAILELETKISLDAYYTIKDCSNKLQNKGIIIGYPGNVRRSHIPFLSLDQFKIDRDTAFLVMDRNEKNLKTISYAELDFKTAEPERFLTKSATYGGMSGGAVVLLDEPLGLCGIHVGGRSGYNQAMSAKHPFILKQAHKEELKDEI